MNWRYDVAASRVETTFTAKTRVMEGPENGPVYGLYPHHWFRKASVEGRLGPAYDTVRGKIRLLAAPEFKTSYAYTGFVPYWPGITESPRKGDLDDVMKSDLRNARRMMLPEGQGAYWQGKGLQRVMKLLDVFEQQGDLEGRDRLLELMKKRMEEWFSGDDSKRYFFYDRSLGTVASYPNEFFGIEEINDHHFWYGYWIRTAAEIALRDPACAARDRWYDEPGIGLAPPQVSRSIQLVVMGCPDEGGFPETVLINPSIVYYGPEQVENWEGCLSVD